MRGTVDSLVFSRTFLIKKKLRRIPVGMGVVAFQRWEKATFHSQQAIAFSD